MGSPEINVSIGWSQLIVIFEIKKSEAMIIKKGLTPVDMSTSNFKIAMLQ